ncbi:MAG: WXG100 family type VII secretion target [Clostridia bacterium]|nr:WXG100 family type VII secretion target [Clostridia bacterium]
MGNIAIYDSAEVRRAARTVRSSMDQLQQVMPKVRSLNQAVSEGIDGETAEAMKNKLKQLQADVQTIGNALSTLNTTLNKFASAIDAADEKIKRILG